MRVVITDVDNTLVCTSTRLEICKRETGGKMNAQFWDTFLSDKYTQYDSPIWEAIYELYRVYKDTRLPVVILSGRSREMERGNSFVRNLLKKVGIEIYEEIYKEWRDNRTVAFKSEEVKKRGYYPMYLFEDDIEIIKYFKEQWEDCTVYYVEDCTSVRLFGD